MTELVHLEARDAGSEEILAAIDRDGALVVENALDAGTVAAILSELEPFIAGTEPFQDDFVGRQTTRTGGLVARSKTARRAVMHPIVLGAAEPFLTRHAQNFQLNLTQIMRLLPGQGAQALHRDRYLWGRSLPREIEPMFNCMWAMTDFDERNGATRIIPGSQDWDWDRPLDSADSIPAVMPLGSVLFYTGSVVHGGGANDSSSPRIGMNITYLLGWLRQEENQYLSCPPEIARELDPELRAMLGYTVGNGSLGYYSPPTPSAGTIDTLPPEMAVGGTATHSEQSPF
ncbi:MAG: phytanoyl-CoA dioxygenase family protein [Deltaproteobacteria bacterium]|jgi:ectoine hydroxylase-related dioxygenase (phytanoyl-CoA dioxygenase family)|nr:phytanoyl-CoA dioxygenase family protein [Deltaproteobacteria bacterium]MBW2495729.1 phytanoyl-CoA dioxygenase family protein [Deltaproteobacteria bacterium]